MRIEITETKIYTWDEMSDDLKEKAIEKLWDINVDHGWWDFVYMDAENIGLKITEFDIDRYMLHGDLTLNIGEIAAKIIVDHGKDCGTYKLAQDYYRRKHEGDSYSEDDFAHDLRQEYHSMLSRNYDYHTSRKAIEKTIACNEYEFDEEGNLA